MLRLALGLAAALPSFGASHASDGSAGDTQAKVDAAASGDTVLLPTGTFAWTTPVTIPATKGLTLQGSGEAKTTIVRGVEGGVSLVVVMTNDTASTRITGIKFIDQHTAPQGPNSGHIYVGSGSPTAAKFRIDHCTFTNEGRNPNTATASTAELHCVHVDQGAYGVIDHCAFNSGVNSEMIHNYGRSLSTASPDWTNDVTPGSAEALYVEDCTFINNCLYATGGVLYFTGNSAVQNYYGARLVFRHNSLRMSHVDVHGTKGNIGGRWWEIYNNTFFTVANGNQSDALGLRGGTGVVFNNMEFVGNRGQGGKIKLQEEDTGAYPELYQLGRGRNQALDAAYFWNNDQGINNSTPTLIKLGRDYFESPRPNYTPFPYPYPYPVTGGK